MKYLATHSELLQLISLVATITITAISAFGLQQLSIAKNSLKTQSLRDARKLSADYTYKYLDRIINFKGKINQSNEQINCLKNFRFSEDGQDYLDYEEISKSDPTIQLDTQDARKKYIDELKQAAKPYFNLLNELEAFSAVVTSGIVDEKTVYRAVGQNFVNRIKKAHLEQFLHFYSKQENLYTNVYEIYQLWNTRLIVDETETVLLLVEKQHRNTEDRIKSLKKRVSKIQTRTIDSIGVETAEHK